MFIKVFKFLALIEPNTPRRHIHTSTSQNPQGICTNELDYTLTLPRSFKLLTFGPLAIVEMTSLSNPSLNEGFIASTSHGWKQPSKHHTDYT